MWQAFLPEERSPDFPASRASSKRCIHQAWSVLIQVLGQSECVFGFSDRARTRPVQQVRSATIEEFQTLFAVERKHCDIDLFHDLPQKRRGFNRAETFRMQRSCEFIHFPD